MRRRQRNKNTQSVRTLFSTLRTEKITHCFALRERKGVHILSLPVTWKGATLQKWTVMDRKEKQREVSRRHRERTAVNNYRHAACGARRVCTCMRKANGCNWSVLTARCCMNNIYMLPPMRYITANLAAWVNDILRNELSYLLLFSVDHNHARRHWIANQRRLVQCMTHFHS